MIDVDQSQALRRVAAAIRDEWKQGVEPNARAALDREPGLRADKVLVLDLAYEEYCWRCDNGSPPDRDAFCDRFPTFRLALREAIDAHLIVEEQGAALAAAAAAPAYWPAPGERLGDLTLLRELGRGGFARVYLATEESTGGRPVAVKLSPEGDVEARTMGRLTHPNVVPILSARFEEAAAMTAVRMPFLGAATLTDLLDRAYPTPEAPPPTSTDVIRDTLRAAARADDPAPLPSGASARLEAGEYTDGVARIGLQIAEALAFLHKEGVVHCDLKPSNVLLGPEGQALLLDFNLSADARAAASRVGGTLPYMAPEQLRAVLRTERGATGAGTASGDIPDGRADLFALGVMLYELLTGNRPYGTSVKGLSIAAAAQAQQERQGRGFTPLRVANTAVDRRLARLVESYLALDPADRPATAAQAAAGLRSYLSTPARLGRVAARRPGIMAAAALLACLAAGGAIAAAAGQDARAVQEYRQGRDAYLAGDYAAARDAFDRAVRDDGTNSLSYLQALAEAELRVGENAEGGAASEAFRLALQDFVSLKDRKRDGATLARLGYCESRLGEHAAAIGWYDEALPAGFSSASLYNDRAYSFIENMQPEPARQDLEEAIRRDENLQAAYYNRAHLAFCHPPNAPAPPIPESALADMRRAVEIGPDSPGLYLFAARLYAAAAKEANPAGGEENARRAFLYLQNGFACGIDPQEDNVQNDPYLSAVLSSRPEFQSLLAAPAKRLPHTNLRLIDPAPYQPQ